MVQSQKPDRSALKILGLISLPCGILAIGATRKPGKTSKKLLLEYSITFDSLLAAALRSVATNSLGGKS